MRVASEGAADRSTRNAARHNMAPHTSHDTPEPHRRGLARLGSPLARVYVEGYHSAPRPEPVSQAHHPASASSYTPAPFSDLISPMESDRQIYLTPSFVLLPRSTFPPRHLSTVSALSASHQSHQTLI
jgi:hypothetical protein